MSTHTGRRHSPQGQHNIAGQINGNTQAQHGVVPGRADGVNRPFPNKPVSHRRSLQPRKQDSFESRGSLLPKEQHSNGTRKTNGAQDPRNDSDSRQPSGELQMARAIHAKELMLQEKLWNVEEKIRQKIRRDTAALHDQKSEEQRHNWGQAERGNTQTTSRLAECFPSQRRELVRREMKMQERGREDVKQHMKTHYQEERARGKRMETEVAQLHKKDHKATHQITVPEQEVSGELNKPWWGKVKEHTRRRERDEKNGIWGEKSQDGTVKAKERHQNTASMGDKGWKRESNYGISDNEQDMPQMSQQKASHKAATEGRKLPPVSQPSHSSRPEPGQLRQEDASLQLLPCTFCNRKFASERLQKHVQICEKVKQSHRGVFNAYRNRTKGSAIEEFWKTHSKSPEVIKKKVNTRNLHEGRLPGGTSQPKWSN
ncbi:golgin subfamily A member 6-like protein 22 [Cyclopterus lumpus]|uniref:golgin subfamily A member 6-like protein 22 n=1 Tax=Cyclopterus lumpus TaxID=8103 RepID=UPI0014867297|nr:golgin subfamily A member 6-like protein 22 [Cyclopterus lumpus]